MKWCPRMRWCWYWHEMWLWFWSAVGSEELSQGQRGSCGVRVGQDRVNWAHAAAAAAQASPLVSSSLEPVST